MNEKILDCFTNPVKCKLILEISARKEATAKQLSDACAEIPQTSLYRYLKTMTDHGILNVVEEHPVRGTVEKVYALADDFAFDIQRTVEENDGPSYMLLFTQFMMGLMQEFKDYTSQPDIDILKDCSAFTLAPVYITPEEWTAAITKIGSILSDLINNEKTPERSLHNIGLILTPPKKID